MIEINIWLEGISGTCCLIQSGKLDQVWVNKDTSITSIMNPEELFEQIFDDLDSANMLKKYKMTGNPGILEIEQFLNSLFVFNAIISDPNKAITTEMAVESLEWKNVVMTAKKVVSADIK